MKIKYFGTAAYEGIPSLFCQCESCKRAMQVGGKNLRTRAQALINDEILMDFNADTLAHYLKFQFDWTKIKYCLITHSHSDHFYPEDLTMFAVPAFTPVVFPVDFYAGNSAYNQLKEVFSSNGSDMSRSVITEVKPGELLQVGDNKVLVMQADHSAEHSSVIYAIEDKSGKRILYAHDTGIFSKEVIAEMKRLGRFDIVSLDCTGAFAAEGWESGHMSLRTNALMKDLLIKEKLADEQTTFVVSHFSHNALFGHTHEELCEEAAKYNFIVAYDGLAVEV